MCIRDSAYTAHAEHRRVRARQTLQGLRPQQQLACLLYTSRCV